jgi:hypothetical protein
VIFPDEGNKDYDEPMIYEQGELEPLFTDDAQTEETHHDQGEESESGVESEPPAKEGMKKSENSPATDNDTANPAADNERDSGQRSNGQEAGDGGQIPNTEATECPHCGEESTFGISDETGYEFCESCGFTPQDAVEANDEPKSEQSDNGTGNESRNHTRDSF